MEGKNSRFHRISTSRRPRERVPRASVPYQGGGGGGDKSRASVFRNDHARPRVLSCRYSSHYAPPSAAVKGEIPAVNLGMISEPPRETRIRLRAGERARGENYDTISAFPAARIFHNFSRRIHVRARVTRLCALSNISNARGNLNRRRILYDARTTRR